MGPDSLLSGVPMRLWTAMLTNPMRGVPKNGSESAEPVSAVTSMFSCF